MTVHVCVVNNEFENEIANLVRAFLPLCAVKIISFSEFHTGKNRILCGYELNEGKLEVFSKLCFGEEFLEQKDRFEFKTNNLLTQKRHIKNALKRSLYQLLSKFTGRRLEWGILTGIRPVKIVHQLMDEGLKGNELISALCEQYLISVSKARLLIEVAQIQRPFIKKNNDKKISLYINIPFCSSRCLYCSFPSATIEECKDYIDDYLRCLVFELHEVIRILRRQKKIIQSVYIGGGTPTALSVFQLEELLRDIDNLLEGMRPEEYTVEGGRPDSFDENKFTLLKKYGVTRISINPQSMSEKTLKKIGRYHTTEQIISCFHTARKFGFENINMDIILGLPDEDVHDVENTISVVSDLSPDSITVHTLAIKRASRLKETLEEYKLPEEKTVECMMQICRTILKEKGFLPYYLYRQKYMLGGNLENIGFAKPGKECIYNIQIMGEKQSIYGFGAGAVSKIYFPEEDRIERIPNVKNIKEYIVRIKEMVERKKKVFETG